MEYTIYLDNSNVFIEGQKVSAVRKGLARDINHAANKKIKDHTYRLDFGKLIQITCGYDSLINQAKLYGSRPPAQDTVWEMAKQKGFTTAIFDRSRYNKEKQVDTSIVVHMMEDIFALEPGTNVIVLVAGDADFVPVVNAAKKKGFTVKVAYWGHASHLLKAAASEFQNLNSFLIDLSYSRGKR